jgi:polysaccharide export outer membrane protein
MSPFPIFRAAAILLAMAMPATADAQGTAPAVTDPGYHLSPGDTVAIVVFNEPELAVTQTIDRAGKVRLPLIGEIMIAGKNVRAAEQSIEGTYVELLYLRKPVVSLVVTAYFPREVSVLGAVRTPGIVVFPRDVTSLDIIEVITRVGGFLPISKTDAVTITRRSPDGRETVTVVDLRDSITGRRQAGRDRDNLEIFPGDRIWVPERLF